MVQEELQMNIFQGALFLFFNRRKDKLKILYWDKSGFALWYKRLEQEKFKIPKNIEGKHLSLTIKELEWLLEGYDISKMKPHQILKYDLCA
jgi:transposase